MTLKKPFIDLDLKDLELKTLIKPKLSESVPIHQKMTHTQKVTLPGKSRF